MTAYEVFGSKICNILNFYTKSVSFQLHAGAALPEEDYTFRLGVPQNNIGRCGKKVRFCKL